MQRSRPILFPSRNISAVLDKESCEDNIVQKRLRYLVQRGLSILVLGCQIGARPHEEPCKINTAAVSHYLMQRGGTDLILGCHIGAVLDEESRELHMAIG